MNTQYTAVIKQDNDWWIGWIEEVPGINCQARSWEELMGNIREIMKEAFEFNKQDAIPS